MPQKTSMNESTLICTLGGQPQIVTFALDWLLRHGSHIRDVYAIHLSPADPRISHALKCLSAEFAGNRYRERPCRF
ncbi:MAG: histidine kinase, partial [Chloroflexi bacterium]